MSTVDTYTEKIFNFMRMRHKLSLADVIIVLGSNDPGVPEYAASVFREGYAPLIVCTGGMAHGEDINNTGWQKSEAEMYKDVLLKADVPDQVIILEKEAKSTGDNCHFSRRVLEHKNIFPKKIILVCKEYFERRAYATFRKQWPEVEVLVYSPEVTYQEFKKRTDVPEEIFMNVMVGDFLRMKDYVLKGFQIEQDIPEDVWAAGEALLALGFDKYRPRES